MNMCRPTEVEFHHDKIKVKEKNFVLKFREKIQDFKIEISQENVPISVMLALHLLL